MAQTVRRETPLRGIAELLDDVICPDGGCAIEGRPMAQPRHAPIDRAVERDAIPGQRALRCDEVLRARTRRWLRGSLRACGGRGAFFDEVAGPRGPRAGSTPWNQGPTAARGCTPHRARHRPPRPLPPLA